MADGCWSQILAIYEHNSWGWRSDARGLQKVEG
jgi:hypothetical protein